MNDKMAYRDYFFHSIYNNIKSNDLFFVIIDKKTSFINLIGLCFGILLLIANNILGLLDFILSGILFDLVLTFGLICYLVPIIKYWRIQFIRMQMDTEKRNKSSESSFFAERRIIAIISLTLFAVVAFQRGFTVPYICSQLNGGGIIRVSVAGEARYYSDILTFDESDPIPITIPPDEDVTVYISVRRTPFPARLSLNGNPLPDIYQLNKKSIDFTDYFRQDGICELPDGVYRDGSILTVTCGDLTREWVFDTAE